MTQVTFPEALKWDILNGPTSTRGSHTESEEDKRATTNVQNGLVFFFIFSFIIFSYL